jgi:hypothetical protein
MDAKFQSMLNKGVYLCFKSVGISQDPVNTQLTIPHFVSVTYDISTGYAIDRPVKGGLLDNLEGNCVMGFDFTKKVTGDYGLVDVLNHFAMTHYARNHFGKISKPLYPIIQTPSMNLKLKENLTIDSSIQGQYDVAIFSLNYKASMKVLFLGQVDMGTDTGTVQALEKEAGIEPFPY